MALISGNVARTSGHQGCFVFGSSEDINARNNLAFGSLGSTRRFAELGAAKLVEIGIFAWKKSLLKPSLEKGEKRRRAS